MASALEEMHPRGTASKAQVKVLDRFPDNNAEGDTTASERKGKGREAKLLAEQEVGRLEKGIKEHTTEVTGGMMLPFVEIEMCGFVLWGMNVRV